jgi:hypothetical protein
MIRNPIPIERGLRIQLPSGNVVEVMKDERDDIECAYRRHAGDNKQARVGVTLRRDFLERRGVFL